MTKIGFIAVMVILDTNKSAMFGNTRKHSTSGISVTSLYVALSIEVQVPSVPTTPSAHSSGCQHCCPAANQVNCTSLLHDTKQLDVETSFSGGVNSANGLSTCITNLLICKQVMKTVPL